MRSYWFGSLWTGLVPSIFKLCSLSQFNRRRSRHCTPHSFNWMRYRCNLSVSSSEEFQHKKPPLWFLVIKIPLLYQTDPPLPGSVMRTQVIVLQPAPASKTISFPARRPSWSSQPFTFLNKLEMQCMRRVVTNSIFALFILHIKLFTGYLPTEFSKQ